MTSFWGRCKKIIVVIIGLAMLGFIGYVALLPVFTQDDVVITVKEKERVVDSDGKGSKYLVWTEEGEVFKNSDYLLFGKFNSASLQGQLNEGQTYNCHVAGVRLSLFSWYRNLIKCEEK